MRIARSSTGALHNIDNYWDVCCKKNENLMKDNFLYTIH